MEVNVSVGQAPRVVAGGAEERHGQPGHRAEGQGLSFLEALGLSRGAVKGTATDEVANDNGAKVLRSPLGSARGGEHGSKLRKERTNVRGEEAGVVVSAVPNGIALARGDKGTKSSNVARGKTALSAEVESPGRIRASVVQSEHHALRAGDGGSLTVKPPTSEAKMASASRTHGTALKPVEGGGEDRSASVASVAINKDFKPPRDVRAVTGKSVPTDGLTGVRSFASGESRGPGNSSLSLKKAVLQQGGVATGMASRFEGLGPGYSAASRAQAEESVVANSTSASALRLFFRQIEPGRDGLHLNDLGKSAENESAAQAVPNLLVHDGQSGTHQSGVQLSASAPVLPVQVTAAESRGEQVVVLRAGAEGAHARVVEKALGSSLKATLFAPNPEVGRALLAGADALHRVLVGLGFASPVVEVANAPVADAFSGSGDGRQSGGEGGAEERRRSSGQRSVWEVFA